MRDLRYDDRVQLTGKGRACGKAILIGEHFVVHGAPAIAVPIRGRGVEITIAPAPRFEVTGALDQRATNIMRQMIERLGIDPETVHLAIEASLPLSGGLGGSAAVAVAMVRALGVTQVDEVRRLAHDLEHLAHGKPSGIDDAVVSYETPMRFERTAEGIRMDRIDAPLPPLWVATVPRTRPTKEAVALVGTFASANPAAFADMISDIAELSDRVQAALPHRALSLIGPAMNEAQRLLDELGVVDPRHQSMVEAARREGAFGAKMTGAGFGGAMLALAPTGLDLAPVLRAAGAEDVFFTGDSG